MQCSDIEQVATNSRLVYLIDICSLEHTHGQDTDYCHTLQDFKFRGIRSALVSSTWLPTDIPPLKANRLLERNPNPTGHLTSCLAAGTRSQDLPFS